MPFLYIAGVLCAAPLTYNLTQFPWNSNDAEQVKIAQRRCGEKYPDTSPCLKTLHKIGERDYRAICGGALNKK
jgi:hypothetical protein